MHTKINAMWGGRFEKGQDALMQEINASIFFDHKLAAQDIAASRAHVWMLGRRGIISEQEAVQIDQGLAEIGVEIEAGQMEFNPALEDIHMHVESRLKEKIGDVAGKLHTARSRNDQVATDFKLYVRDALDVQERLLAQLQTVLLAQAKRYADTIMPGFTHLQTAQPVTFGHHMMAYVEMFGRDRSRVRDARERMNECPLGAAALAGTSFPIDREQTAHALYFQGPTRNSLDSVSDRDFALEFLSLTSITALHLSRLGEELVIWSSAPFSFVRLPDSFTTGSSIMPQKKNPDAAELLRGKSGRVIGDMVALFATMKGLSLAYNKDMQEDKEPVFDAHEHLCLCLRAAGGMIAGLEANAQAMRAAAAQGFATATDLADWLVRTLQMPFREAHHATGAIVKKAEDRGVDLSELSLEDMQAVEPRITQDVFSVLTVEYSVASRASFGGTAPERVREAIAEAKERYGL